MSRPEPRIAAAGLTAALLCGCATSALEMAPARPDRPWTPAVTPQGEIIAGARPRAESAAGYVLPENRAIEPPPPASVESGKVYTLAELIDLAESNNPQTRIAWNDARKAALAAGVAESVYLPRVAATVAAAANWTGGHTNVQVVRFGADESAQGMISVLSMQWLLFDFGERAAVVEAARQGSVISNIAFTATHQKLIHDVSLAFYAHAAARARLSNSELALSNARAVQVAAEDRYKRGIGTVIEVAQARQATAQASLASVQASGAADDSYLALIAAMGLSPLTRIRIADASDHKLTPAVSADLDKLVAESLRRRPDVLSAFAGQRATQAGVRAARAEFKPKAFVAAAAGYASGGLDISAVPSATGAASNVDLNGRQFGATVFAGVTVPLYDAGTRSAALARARAEADSADARLTAVRDEAMREIVSANNTLRTSLAAYEASRALASAAQTTFDGSLAAYRSGVGSITDLTIAQSQLLQAQTASADAYSAALSAAASLAFATGALGAAPS
jgi:outer membrane protein TolC